MNKQTNDGNSPLSGKIMTAGARHFIACAAWALMLLTISQPVTAMPDGAGSSNSLVAPQFIQVLTAQGVTALTDASLEPLERRAAMRDTFTTSFATEAIARLTLGRHWITASDEEKEHFIVALTEFVASTVVDNLPTTGHFEIFATNEIDSPESENRRFEVNTVLVTDHFSSPIIWTIDVIEGQPKVLDLAINNKSFLQSQKTEFATILRRNGGSIEDLIAQITPTVN